MRRDDRIRLRHMIEAGEAIGEFVSGRTRKDLEEIPALLPLLRGALEREPDGGEA